MRLEAYSFLGYPEGHRVETETDAEAQAYFPTGYSLPNPSVQEPTG